MKLLVVLSFALGMGLCSQPASAQKPAKFQPDRFQISYDPPKNPAHEPVLRLLKERQVLEKFKAFLSPLRLPRKLQLKFQGCDGVSNAWYGGDEITVCYEYIEDIFQNAPQETTPAGVTRADAIVGPTLEVFLHEFGHAVFDYLKIPILGREEDAADQFAAYLLLQFAKSDARRLIVGTAHAYNVDASKPTTKKNPFADEHGLPGGSARGEVHQLPVVARLVLGTQRVLARREAREVGPHVEPHHEVAVRRQHVGHMRPKVHPPAVTARHDGHRTATPAVET